MNQDILDMVTTVSNEKNLEREVVFWVLEECLAAASKRKISLESDIRVRMDRKSAEYKTYRCWTVVPEAPEENEESEQEPPPPFYSQQPLPEEENFFRHEDRHYTLEQALLKDPEAELDKVYEEQVENIDFSRITSQVGRNVLFAKLREAERLRTAKEYRDRVGELLHGTIKRISTNKERKFFVELDSMAEAMLPRHGQLEQDEFHLNMTVHAVLSKVEDTQRGPQLILSRTQPEMVIALLQREVPEVAEQVVEIKAIARQAGGCCKIAVASRDARIDPVGACVGIGGVRVKQIMQELKGERVDIFPWDDDVAKLVLHAMAPAQPVSVTLDERRKKIDFVVQQAQQARAIGRHGQNVYLASCITDWAIHVLSEEEAAQQQETQSEHERSELAQQLDISEEMARVLMDARIHSLDDLVEAEPEDLAKLEGLNEEEAEEMIDKASDLLLREVVLAGDEESGPLDQALVDLPGMDPELAQTLLQAGFGTREQLAAADLGEVMEQLPDLNEKSEDYIGTLIVAARRERIQAIKNSEPNEESS